MSLYKTIEPNFSNPWTNVMDFVAYDVKGVKVKVGGTEVFIVIGLNLYFVLDVLNNLTHLRANVDW